MSAKRQIAAALDELPDSITVEEALDRLYRAFKLKQALAGAKGAAAPASQSQTDAKAEILRLLDEERIAEARERAAQSGPRKWAQILAPPVVSIGSAASGQGITNQAQDAAGELAQHAGKWVALRGGKVIDAAERRGDLRRRLEARGELAGTVFMKVEG